jgi:hypothetical protein
MGKYAMIVVLTLVVALGYLAVSNSSSVSDAIHESADQGKRKILQNLATSHANATLQKLRELDENDLFDAKDFNYTKSIPAHDATVDVHVDNLDSDNQLIIGEYKITSIVKDETLETKTVVFDRQLPFSYYALFLDEFPSNAYYYNGESVNGPVHSNSTFNVGGQPGPLFEGNVTVKNGVKYFAGASASNYKGFKGDNNNFNHPEIPLGSQLQLADEHLDGSFKLDNTFQGNGPLYINLTQDIDGEQIIEITDVPYTNPNLQRNHHQNNSQYEKYLAKHKVVVKASELENGILYSQKRKLHLKGTLDGRLSVTSEKDIYLDDDIVYKDDPRVVPDSDDMLGIMSNGDIIVTTEKDKYTGKFHNTKDDPDSEYDGLVVMANIYTTGSMRVQNLSGGYLKQQDAWGRWTTSGVPQDRGSWTVVGGRVQRELSATMSSHGYSGKSGFGEVIDYDDRFRGDAPPGVPYTDERRITRWYESF